MCILKANLVSPLRLLPVCFTLQWAVRVNLHNNSFTGNLDPLICNETTGILASVATADCGLYADPDYPYFVAEVNCTCCTECCDDISGCPYFDTEAPSCELARSLTLEANPFISCNCTSDMDLLLSPSDSGAATGTTMLCEFAPLFQYCNSDLTDCAFGSFAREYDDSGIYLGEWKRYEYYSGKYSGEVVTFIESINDLQCEVDVNGVGCSSCLRAQCPDFHDTWEVRCDNVEEGLAFLGCSAETTTNPSSSGQLQTLNPQFNLMLYNPGYCARNIQGVEAENRGFSCGCSDDGLLFYCEQQACNYCYDGIISNDNKTAADDQMLCFTYDESYYYVFGDISYHTVVTNHHINRLPHSADEDSSNHLVTLVQSLVDLTCAVFISGEECISCENVLCGDDSIGQVVNCTNIANNGNSTSIPQLVFNGCNQTSMSYEDVGILQVLQPYNEANCETTRTNQTEDGSDIFQRLF